MHRFEGTASYVATDDLKVAVNAAIILRRPLLVKGEPGTGARPCSRRRSRPAAGRAADRVERQVDHQGAPGALRIRCRRPPARRTSSATSGSTTSRNYIKRGKLWDAFTSPQLPVLLIDEIDKADIEFPNDLLQELDRMSFDVYETGERIAAAERPIVVITSNNEKELPDAFLRRCFFHYIKFPDRETMQAIIDVHFPGIQKILVTKAMDVFYEVREVARPQEEAQHQRAARLAQAAAERGHAARRPPEPATRPRRSRPLHGALLKNEQDVMLFERLAFMARRQGG